MFAWVCFWSALTDSYINKIFEYIYLHAAPKGSGNVSFILTSQLLVFMFVANITAELGGARSKNVCDI